MSAHAAAGSLLGAVLCAKESLLSSRIPLQGFMKQVSVVAVAEILLLPATLCQCSCFQNLTVQIGQLSAFHLDTGNDTRRE